MTHPDVGPLYIFQILALAIKFGYGRLITSCLVITENVKLGYRRLPGIISTNVLLGYGRLQYNILFSITFKYRGTAFLLS